MRVVIIGAGGHGQVVADLLMRMNEQSQRLELVGYLDDDPDLWNQHRLGLPVLGAIEQLPRLAHDAVIIAIGDNARRRQIAERLGEMNETLIVGCHPRSVVAPDVTVGRGAMLCANAVVNPGSVIGANVILNTSCSVDHHNQIGDYAHIAPGANLGGEVLVGEGALVGIGAVIMPWRRVGAWSIVGAGALVHEDVPEGATVIGVPARVLR